jgi:hypothetical protein
MQHEKNSLELGALKPEPPLESRFFSFSLDEARSLALFYRGQIRQSLYRFRR